MAFSTLKESKLGTGTHLVGIIMKCVAQGMIRNHIGHLGTMKGGGVWRKMLSSFERLY
jgi:hypothetical protein